MRLKPPQRKRAMTLGQYARIAAIKPTTAGGVLRQLELAARGWIAPSTVPTAMTALREIVDRPLPFKAGQLPPVPPSTVYERRADFVGGGTAREQRGSMRG